MTGDWVLLIVVAGIACFRLTRLVVKDDFPLVAKPREWVVGGEKWDESAGAWYPENKHEGKWYFWFGELISCHWCASGWIALGLVGGVALFTSREAPLWDWFLTWIAVWGIGSVTADKVG